MRFAESSDFENHSVYNKPAENICQVHFDTVALIREEVFIFKGEYVWRLTTDFHIQPGYPVKFRNIFTDLPIKIKRIDAAYERPTDNAIILFSGSYAQRIQL